MATDPQRRSSVEEAEQEMSARGTSCLWKKKDTSHSRMKNIFPCVWEVNTEKNVVLWLTSLAEFCLL